MDSQRVINTKLKIKKAFLELHRTKRIEQISIKEITKSAGINRGTFYVYYLDIYDLQEKIEDEGIEEIKKNALPVIQSLVKTGKLNFNLLPKNFFCKNKDVLNLFFGKSAEARTVEKLKVIMQQTVAEMLGSTENLEEKERVKLEYALEYIAGAQLGMIGYWVRQDMNLEIEDLAEIMEKINLTGAITYLASIGK